MNKEIKELWEKVKKEYKQDTRIISVNVSKAKQIIMTESDSIFIWYIINSLIPIIIIIISFIKLGFSFGLIFNIIFVILYITMIGTSSISPKKGDYISIIIALISGMIISDIPILLLPCILMQLEFISINLFYEYIIKQIIELSLNNIVYFFTYLKLGIIIIRFPLV